MQSSYTPFIKRSEWRWVILISTVLILMIFLPFLLLALADGDWQFMGAIHGAVDQAAHLDKIQQGAEGKWLLQLRHTGEAHNGALIYPLYALLGHLTRLVLPEPIILFHLSRMVAAYVMYLALYQLGAAIWIRVRTRQIFFILVALGSGFGWLHSLLARAVIAPDLTIPDIYPFFSTIIDVHTPLTIAALAMMAAVLISVFRPGEQALPGADNGGILLALLSLTISFLQPEALLPIAIAILFNVIVQGVRKRRIPIRELTWALWSLVPSLPLVAYYTLSLVVNPAIQTWVQQSATQVIPSPLLLIVGLGLPLVIALPGLWRAIRRFESDGDRFMLVWLLAMVLSLYNPIPMLPGVTTGLMLPVAYFAARSIEDFWFNFIRRQQQRRLYIAIVPLMSLSHIFVLFLPVMPLIFNSGPAGPTVLEPEYRAAFVYIEARARPDDVVMAAPSVSAWIPYWTGARVVYGHPSQTLNAEEKRQRVQEFYRHDGSDCMILLNIAALDWGTYAVDYVVFGPREQMLGGGACLDEMRLARQIGSVQVYRVPEP